MKHFIYILSLFLSTAIYGQSEVTFLKAFGDDDLSTVVNLLSDNITLCINDDVKEVSKNEAIRRIEAFISNENISRKKILHNGKSSDKDSSYKVARIKTESGTYRVFAYSEKDGTKSIIKEIRIDKM